ncbi:MAG: hypothetical protein KAS75_00980 [Planctomycetes bacterium]|nr:hypothetical protein [Planctomycetota bacterium]MCK5602130.1 hypothetical protein [Candidatus Pacearchaeota archaeon]
MNKEDSNLKRGEAEEHGSAEDLKFVRSAMEKTCLLIKPKTSNTVMWGLIAMTAYVGAHFLVKNQLYHWLKPLQISLMSVGVICSIIQGHFLLKKLRQQGFVPQFLGSISYGLLIIVVPVFIFDMLGLFKGMYYESAFIYAFMTNSLMALCGVLYSRLFLSGTILVTAGMFAAFIFKDYPLLILGIAIGTGVILSAVTVDLHYRKLEKENG